MTKYIDFRVNKVPTPTVSNTLLDFGLDSTRLKFNISKIGTGTLTYAFSKSQDWITVSPSGGEITDEADTITITVNINKTGLSKRIYKETITVAQYISPDESNDVIIDVYLNGFWLDSKYVNLVRIGTQIWMGENLNVGTRIDGSKDQTNNGISEKYCYNDVDYNCDIYGGLYQWNEMMQYNPAEDTGKVIGTTQGICPDGWHIPIIKEWNNITIFLGGDSDAGGKLKEAGFAHWLAPNKGATNESGFTGLPGGYLQANTTEFFEIGVFGCWRSSVLYTGTLDNLRTPYLRSDNSRFDYGISYPKDGCSVRCVKNPGK
jgi:uncharacterized protein (TIGR02145 family)